MEALSFLKFWRPGAANLASGESSDTKGVVAAATEVISCSSDGEDGTYIDLEFIIPDQEEEEDSSEKAGKKHDDELKLASDEEIDYGSENDDEEDMKFGFTGECDKDESNVVSPDSGEVFLEGKLVPIEPASILVNGSEENSRLAVFLLKSATKFRVLLLKLKKSKFERSEVSGEQGKVTGKILAVKFKVDEVPILSLLTREKNSRKQNDDSSTNTPSDDRKLVKKYFKMVKHLQIPDSKRYVEKLKFTGQLRFNAGGSKGCTAGPEPPSPGEKSSNSELPPSNMKTQLKQVGNTGLKVVRKHLAKSRSATSSIATTPRAKPDHKNKRDDSLLQVEEGIQGAILHCKKSFNATIGKK